MLQRDASQPYAALGQAVGLSPGAAHERVRKLRERGVIRRTTIEVDPAAVGRGVLVEAPGTVSRCLLARHRGAAPGSFATLAGFVEIGEGLEDAVRQEVAEETGVRLGKVSYLALQAWPFPAGLMIGFRARAVSEAICVDLAELAEARWFTRAEVSAMLARHPARPDSIESHLIGAWLREAA